MTNAKLMFSTDILRRLGEELNPTPDKGLLELVKNSYDADALECIVQLSNTDKPGGSFTIIDNGDGMTIDQIEKGWLVLGRSTKDSNKRTRLGRIPAGNKGLGRLAAIRMGEKVVMKTRPSAEKGIEYEIEIIWNDYDYVDLVDEVTLNIKRKNSDKRSGTEILVDNLVTSISRLEIKRLAREIILLADPFGDNPYGFQPKLIAPEFSELEKLVENRYFDEAEFYLSASVDNNGIVHAKVKDWREKLLFSANHEEIASSRKGGRYNCPPAIFDIWIFILSGEKFRTRSITLTEVREWLREFGGIHLFENDLRVAPYGNPGHDWLEMNLRRTQSPEERPSTNTSIGRVSVTDLNNFLVQKTDRSGFIEDEFFLELKYFAQDSLEWLATRRLEVAEERRAVERKNAEIKSTKSKENIEDVIDNAPQGIKVDLKTAFKQYNRDKQQEVNELKREVQLYRTLSTAGITSATFAHESSGNPIKVISQAINTIERRAKVLNDGIYPELLEKPVEIIKKSLKALAVLGNATLKLLDYEKRRLGRVDVHEVIKSVLSTFKPFLDERDVKCELDLLNGKPYLHGSEAAIESIITNLLNNCIAAFEADGSTNRLVIIQTQLRGKNLTLSVLDNGPGIRDISLNDIWLPGKTTRPNGTGLGLTIVKDSVVDLGGNVDAIANGELGGAEIIVDLPILGY